DHRQDSGGNLRETGGNSLVAGHRYGNWIIRAADITAPSREDKSGVRGGPHSDRRSVAVFQEVGIARDRATGSGESIEPPIPRWQLMRRNFLTRIVEQETHV